MKTGSDALWTIDELSERVAEMLQAPDYGGVSSGRVRDVPDLRTIRYYTTLGLLDRPAAMRGRTALYGRWHMLQLVAIKRLQARGLSLAQVQERVLGLSEAALSRLVAAEAAAAPRAEAAAAPLAAPARSESFWRATPGPVAGQAEGKSTEAQRVLLGFGLELSLEAPRALEYDDLKVIRMAAAPLIEILRLRGLIGVGPSEPRK
jgi:DNA-binding transcriptional MerR regulator